MPALVFYFDASIPKPVFDAIALVRDDDVTYPGVGTCPVTDRAILDRDWLPIIGQREWPVIMRDKRIRSRPLERQRFNDHNVKGFVLTGAGNYSRWRTLDLLVRRWDEMTDRALNEAGPFMYSVTQTGLKPLPI